MRTLQAFFAVVACLVLTGAGCATPEPSSAVVEAAPFHLAADQHSRLIRFRRIVADIPPGTVVGDWNCGSGKDSIIYDHSVQDLDPRYNGEIFRGVLAQAGYQILDPGGSLFDAQDTEAETQLEVAAKITKIMANGCLPERSAIGIFRPDLASVFDPTLDMTLTIEWQFYDPLTRRVVGTTTTQGRATLTEKRASVYNSVHRLAFAQAARNLAADASFQRVAIGNGEPSPPDKVAEPIPTTTIARLPLSSKPFSEQVANLQKHVVTVSSPLGSGSGYYIADGLLLTNQHVVGNGKDVRVRFLSGKEIPGEVVTTNARRDVALIKTESVGLKGLPVHTDDPALSSRVFVIGSPAGKEFEGTVTSGIVSSIREFERRRFIQSDVAITHGNSGGPMFDDMGNVIGMTDLGIPHQNSLITINLFIPVGEALESVGVTLQDPAVKRTSAVDIKHPAVP